MIENIPQTSASERIENARKALAEYEKSVDNVHADDLTREELAMAEALRALITPPSMGVTPEQLAAEFEARITEHGSIEILGAAAAYGKGHAQSVEAFRLGVESGVYAAHATWEPADRPSQEQMLRWLGIEYDDRYNEAGYEDGYLIIEQFIEREEI